VLNNRAVFYVDTDGLLIRESETEKLPIGSEHGELKVDT
jgi:hypothetical protein